MSSSLLQVVLPKALREEVLKDLQEGALGENLESDKILSQLKKRFHWPGCIQLVPKLWDLCVRKEPSSKSQGSSLSFVVGYHMQLVAMDIVGPFPETTPEGEAYVLVVPDYFTRWTKSIPALQPRSQ